MPPEPGEIVATDPQIIRIAPLLAQGTEDVGGFQFRLFSFEFIVLVAGIDSGVRTKFDDAFYRPAGITVVGSNAHIVFAWQDGPQSGDVVLNYVR